MHTYLPKYYHFIDNLNTKDINKLKKNIVLIYRNYKKKPTDQDIIKFKKYCKNNHIKFIISNYPDIAIKHNLDGLYIPSFNLKKIYQIVKNKKNFIIIGSAHNLKQIRIKEMQGVQLIFFSPLFKRKGLNQSLGLYRYNSLANLTKLPNIALGGINKINLKLIKLINANGFASISYFKY